jgi:crotonobetainyl-CoA:carnitine CoA-transferase CaiB-like acyl-CoA transferase
MSQGALTGIRVLDFGQYIAGPFAATLLAEQGADVIKVERPGGDPMRGQDGFMVWNRSKKGITLDLKKPGGLKIALDLAKKADVIIENFKPGTADRLGIGYDKIRELNPRAVYCS